VLLNGLFQIGDKNKRDLQLMGIFHDYLAEERAIFKRLLDSRREFILGIAGNGLHSALRVDISRATDFDKDIDFLADMLVVDSKDKPAGHFCG